MIERFEISSFKSISSLSIDLGQINIFLGANGAGKSNILEALGIVSAAAFGIVDDESLLRRGVRPGVPRLYKTSNIHSEHSAQISFSARSKQCEYRISLLNPLDTPRPQWDYKTETFISGNAPLYSKGVRSRTNSAAGGMPALLSNLKADSLEYRFLQELRNYAVYDPNTPMLRGTVPDPQTRSPVGLSGGGLSEGLKDLLQATKDNEELEYAVDELTGLFDWVKTVNTETSTSTILSQSVARPKRVITFIDRYMKDKSNRLTAYDASEGILYVLFLAVLCLSRQGPSVFSVDNIDQCLNPRLVRQVIQSMHSWFTELSPEKQILCTAHNPAILDGIDFSDHTVRVFMVDRDSSGLTRVSDVHMTDETIAMAQKRGISFSQLWMEGYLGGVPNV